MYPFHILAPLKEKNDTTIYIQMFLKSSSVTFLSLPLSLQARWVTRHFLLQQFKAAEGGIHTKLGDLFCGFFSPLTFCTNRRSIAAAGLVAFSPQWQFILRIVPFYLHTFDTMFQVRVIQLVHFFDGQFVRSARSTILYHVQFLPRN